MDLTEPQMQRIRDLSDRILDPWVKRHTQLPDVLYHYTSADGLIGILTSRSIWLTDLRYMNDLSEMQYSRELLGMRLAERLKQPALSETQRDFLTRVSSNVGPFYRVFSASFCEEGNLLSQWRAYRGKGGGYAIGFDFFHVLRLLNRPCVLRKVVYDENEQVRLFDSVIHEFLAVVQHEVDTNPNREAIASFLPELCQAFKSVIAEFLSSVKHPDFREEQEWRLVHFASSIPELSDGDAPSFRSYDGNVIPYFSVDFGRAVALSLDDTYCHPFPIVDLMIGPTISADLNQASIKLLLLSLNPEHSPSIRSSGIPLRWL